MLAGYLPFDDDPANPEGDNINLLYKYIVSTPLTFPEYVTPHARDLLRRILVPDPRKRADLFEVARHSWLSEYAHVVGFITSTTTTSADIVESTIPTGNMSLQRKRHYSATDAITDDQYDVPQLARSASVREPSKPSQISVPGGLVNKNVPINEPETKTPRDAKRRTVQVEYVAPQSQTVRQQPISASLPASVAMAQPAPPPSQGRSRARGDSAGGPVAVNPASYDPSAGPQRSQQRPATQSAMSPPVRPNREPTRAVTDSTPFTVGSPTSTARPTTSGSRLPSRGNSYGQPALATVAATNAEGRFSQPKSSGYIISGPNSQDGSKRNSYTGRPVSQHLPSDYQAAPQQPAERPVRGHKRSNTVESFTTKLFGRSGSRRQSATPQEIANARQEREKSSRMYPPVSMKNAMPHSGEDLPRPSTESSRRSFGYNRKTSETAGPRSSRRFSFLPVSFSRMSFSGASGPEAAEGAGRRASVQANARSRPASKQSPVMAFGQGRSRSPSQSTTSSSIPTVHDNNVDGRRKMTHQPVRGATAPDLTKMQDPGFSQQQQFSRQQQQEQYNNYTPPQSSAGRPRQENFYTPSQSAESQASDSIAQTPRQQYPSGFNETEPAVQAKPQHRQQAVLQKNRKFGDAYEGHGNGGSSGGARRVMDWFRKRGKDRSN